MPDTVYCKNCEKWVDASEADLHDLNNESYGVGNSTLSPDDTDYKCLVCGYTAAYRDNFISHKCYPTDHHAAQSQPLPGKTKVLDAVIDDLTKRAEFGKNKYGTYLYTDNGRNALIDAYQELCDAVMYTKQLLLEFDDIEFVEKWLAELKRKKGK